MLVVGANLALDRTLRMPQLLPGRIQRPRSAEASPGGKAVNVCRAAQAHGVRPRLVANLPGALGRHVGDLLDHEGHDVHRVPTSGDIRSATIIIEDDLRVTVLNEPGPVLATGDRAALLHAATGEGVGHRVAVLSGSLPPGGSRLYVDLVAALRGRGLRVVLDSARADFTDALPAGPDVVVPNLAEALAVVHGPGEETVESDVPDVSATALVAARHLVAVGAGAAVVTAGRHGVFGVDGRGAFRVAAPEVDEVNPIGAGDAFAAGLGVALDRGEDLRDAVVLAVATGSASVATRVAGEVDADLLRALNGRLRWETA